MKLFCFISESENKYGHFIFKRKIDRIVLKKYKREKQKIKKQKKKSMRES